MSIKDEAHKLIDQLADDATWADVCYAFYVREVVERGLAESARGEAGIGVDDIRDAYGLRRLASLV
ncbi:hypothetical protein AYO38_11060 [bacterium SCGC AG-212-C10]|nr:hypothetical protein AYO38_11060 [bacterium SCGC AG-212-C10]